MDFHGPFICRFNYSQIANAQYISNLFIGFVAGTGFELPSAAANALNMAPGPQQAQQQQQGAPPIATQCFMLSNMFDPAK